LVIGHSAFVILLLSGLGLRADALRRGDEQVLQEAGVGTDDDSLLAFFHKRTLGENDLRRLEQHVRHLGDKAFRTREQASRELVEVGVPALPFLKLALADDDLEIARRAERCIACIHNGPGPGLAVAAVRRLARRQPPGTVEALLGYLPFAEDALVEEAILTSLLALGSSGEGVVPSLEAALQAPHPARRAAAAYALGRRADAELRAIVRRLLVDPDPRVRLRAAQALVAGQDKSAVPVLVALLEEAPAELCWHAENLLLRLAGEQAPVGWPGDASAEARHNWRSAWAAWWREHGPTVDLARLEQGPPFLGLTVIAQMDLGQVWECDRAGNPRWMLEKLQGPLDAQVLPGGRVLVAEHHGRRVTERDLSGKVLWEKRLEHGPVACQRLPNGNTFIATYGGLLEVARDGKEVYAYEAARLVPPGQSFPIYGGHKLPDGRIVCVALNGKVVELDAVTGKVLRSLQATEGECYSVEGLPDGCLLVTNFRDNKVLEIAPDGKAAWQCTVPGVYHATRLPNGHLLVSNRSSRRVAEIDRQGQTVWEQPLANGNVWRVHAR
jgi:outer membrane protein assembly factor BamB